MPRETFYQVVTAAIRAISEQGYVSIAQITAWADRIRAAAVRDMVSPAVLEESLKKTYATQFRRLIDTGSILKMHKGAPKFTIDRVKPKLRAELDRSIMASADLIKLNRVAATEKTIQRFSGWATSIPAWGSKVVDRQAENAHIRKAMASLPFEERRCIIDQSSKFVNNLNAIIAKDANAIAFTWHHHHVTYPRPEHVARDGETFLIRDSWAHEKGLVKSGGRPYTDEIDLPGQKIMCRCSASYLYGIADLPSNMITNAGEMSLRAARAAARAFMAA